MEDFKLNYRVHNKREVEEAVEFLKRENHAEYTISEEHFMDGFKKYNYDGYVRVSKGSYRNTLHYADSSYIPSNNNQEEVEWSDYIPAMYIENSTTGDAVYKPNHYQLEDGTEVKDHIRSLLGDEGFKSYAIGNAIKYIGRYADKGKPKQDLQKAKEYLDMVIELLEGEN